MNRSNLFVAKHVALAGALVGALVAAKPVEPGVPGLSFRLSSSVKVYAGNTPRGQDDEVMRGRGVAANGRSRVEFLAFTPTPQGLTTDDYLVTGDSGRTVLFHSGSQTFADANDTFDGPAVVALARVLGGGGRGFPGGRGGPPDGTGGGGFRGGRGNRGGGGGFPGRGAGRGRGRGALGQGFLSQLQLLDVNFKLEDLGAGDAIEGHATHHYRVTTDYRVIWGDQSLPAHAVTELWSTELATNVPNPFEPLIVADQSTDGPLIEYALKLRAVRSKIAGTPIKVVTTTTLSGIHDIVGFQSYVGDDPTVDTLTVVQQTQITNIQPADVDPAQLAVPDLSGE